MPRSKSLNRKQIFVLECAVLIALFVLAAWLRFDDLGARTLGHPENYTSGLPNTDWNTWPSPRRTTLEVLQSLRWDGHPPMFFLMSLVWVKIFGTGLFAIRALPALLGVLSVPLAYAVARRELPRSWAMAAAGALSIHGFHILYSQQSRLYSTVSFFGLLATLWLFRVLEHDRPRDRLLYGVFASAAMWTNIYAWPLIFAHMVWASLRALAHRVRPAALGIQFAAVISAFPVVALALVQDPTSRWHDPIIEYFELGFARYSRAYFWGPTPSPWYQGVWLAVLCLGLMGLYAWQRAPVQPTRVMPRTTRKRSLDFRLLALAVFIAAGMAWLYISTGKVQKRTVASCFAPLAIALVGPWLINAWDRGLGLTSGWRKGLDVLAGVPATVQLALLPALCMILVSVIRGVWVARGTVAFTPYFLIAVFGGLAVLVRWSWGRYASAGLSVLLFSVLVSSAVHFHGAQFGPRDYAGLARAFLPQVRSTDLILVQHHFTYGPLFCYSESVHERMVPEHWDRAIRASPRARVWYVQIDHAPNGGAMPSAMKQALAGYQAGEVIEAHGLRARLMEPR